MTQLKRGSCVRPVITWISISDMGNSELYLTDSSEYLTPEAVKKFHVSVVPDDTVLLSFKLTVGRIGITDGAMTSNEAIVQTAGFPGRLGRISRPRRAEFYGQRFII